MKLKSQFVLAFSLFALIPALTVGIITKVIVGDEGIKDAQDNGTQLLELAQGGTESIMDMAVRINNQSSSEVVFKLYLEGSALVEDSVIANRLKELVATYKIFDNALITDTDGIVIGSDDDSMIGTDCNALWPDTMSEVKSTGQQVISKATKNVISGNVMLIMVTPIKDGNNLQGYFLSALNVKEIYNKVIAKAKLFDTGYIYVVEPDGTMLMHPNSDLLLDKKAFNDLPIADEVKESQHGNGLYTFEGTERYYTFDTDSNGWSYVAVMPKEEVESLIDFIVKLLMIVMGVVVVVAPLISVFIANGMIKPIKKVSSGIALLANGDFSKKIDVNKKNELGQMATELNKTAGSLAGAVSGVKSTSLLMGNQSHDLSKMSNEITQVINEMNESIDTINSGSTAQAEDIQETLEMLISLENEINEIADNLNLVAESAVNAQGEASAGEKIVNTLVGAIGDIRETFRQFSKKITDLGITVSEISNITNTINDIASQTNLLALNASIEAARAGEMGKGFAVVAEEVGSLAEQSKKSAEEIGLLIHNVSQETAGVVKDSSHVDELLEEQSKIVEDVLGAFEATMESIQVAEPKIKKTFSSLDIAEKAGHSVREKAESIAASAEEVVASTERIAATSQELLAMSENVSSNAEKTDQVADELNRTMSAFQC